jgi:hypothetical protein
MVFTVACLFISFLFMNKCTKSTYLEDSEIVWCVCMPSYDLIVSVSICYLLLQPVVLKSGFPAPHIRVFEGEMEGEGRKERERKCACVCAYVFDWTRVDVRSYTRMDLSHNHMRGRSKRYTFHPQNIWFLLVWGEILSSW